MKTSEFVARLAALAPSLEELATFGLVGEEAAGVRANFICTPRDGSPTGKETLASLIGDFDCRAVQVGALNLRKTPFHDPAGVTVGYLEADPVIETEDGAVVCRQHDDPNRVIPVAPNPAATLDALYRAAAYNANRDGRSREEVLADILSCTGTNTERFWQQVLKAERRR